MAATRRTPARPSRLRNQRAQSRGRGPVRRGSAERPAAVPPEVERGRSRDRLEVRGVAVSHPDRIIFEDTGLTKGALAEYYAAAARWMLKDVAGHPLTLLRCPQGASGDCFYQRNPGTGLGPDVQPFHWKHKGKSYRYLYIEEVKGLIELVQMGAIELHPWGARVARIDYPDRLIFDLDPDDSVPFEAVKLAARDLRARLKRKGLESSPKCTGGKGLHVIVPLAEVDDWETVKRFAGSVASEMVRDVPVAYVANMRKAKRKSKIFIDYFRNDYTATSIADFSVRARPSSPVAVPLEWDELDDLRSSSQYTIADAIERLKTLRPDARRGRRRQKLPEG